MRLTLDVVPTPQKRPKFCRIGNKVRAIDPSKREKNAIRSLLHAIWFHDPLEAPIEIYVTFYVPIPKSFSKKKKERAEEDLIKPTVKPDIDNYLKLLLDACNGILYRDDALIVSIHCQKRYSQNPRIDLKIQTI